MSLTWVAEFENKKDYRLFLDRFQEIAPEGGNVIVPDLPKCPDRIRQRGAFVVLDETVYDYTMGMGEDFVTSINKIPSQKHPAWAISFDIAIWDKWTNSLIICIFQEMCQRYKLVKIGCTSSHTLVSQEEFLKWELFSKDKREMEFIKQEFIDHPEIFKDTDVTYDDFAIIDKEFLDTENKFREASKRFFDGDASDLILTFDKK